ncbi:MAG: hypothetical protein AAB657_03355 [Patescibacteria group bacterium]
MRPLKYILSYLFFLTITGFIYQSALSVRQEKAVAILATAFGSMILLYVVILFTNQLVPKKNIYGIKIFLLMAGIVPLANSALAIFYIESLENIWIVLLFAINILVIGKYWIWLINKQIKFSNTFTFIFFFSITFLATGLEWLLYLTSAVEKIPWLLQVIWDYFM